ncbi:MAG: sugar kinase [Deltaproteobacteria bacterium]|nr:sugar kinase [Deltaproteobacteria bacterium]
MISTRNSLENVEVVGLGQACVDYLGRIPAYPREDGKVELTDLYTQCGGPASTALVTLSRFGIKTAFLGSISDDPFGVEIRKGLKEEKVDATFLKVSPGYTSQFAFIAITKKSSARTIFWDRGSVPHLTSNDIDLSPFSHAHVLHTDGLMLEASIEAANQAKDRGMTIVMDAGTLRRGCRELVSLVDVLIASQGFGEALVGSGEPHEKTLEALAQWGPREVIITLGAKGSVGWSNGTITSQDAFSVEVMDTTGAGDVYHGAYIYGLLQGWNMPECMRFASAASALKCTEIGGRKGIPTLEKVNDLLKKA